MGTSIQNYITVNILIRIWLKNITTMCNACYIVGSIDPQLDFMISFIVWTQIVSQPLHVGKISKSPLFKEFELRSVSSTEPLDECIEMYGYFSELPACIYMDQYVSVSLNVICPLQHVVLTEFFLSHFSSHKLLLLIAMSKLFLEKPAKSINIAI